MTALRTSVVFALVLVVGCSQKLPSNPTTYPVKGKVLLNGQPLATGTVVMHLLSEGLAVEARGALGKDGTFSVQAFGDREGTVPGKYIVTILPVGGAPPADSKAKVPASKVKSTGPKNLASEIPEKYQSPDTSDIEVTVEEKDNDLGTIKISTPKAGGALKK